MVEAGIDFTAERELTEDGYGLTEAKIDNLIDAVAYQTHVLISVHGGKPGRFKPVKRPKNAIERYYEKQRVKRYSDLLDEVAQAQEKRRQKQAE